jgi:flagellar basal body rod protein FlgG
MKKAIVLTLVLAITASCSAQWGKKIKGNGEKVTIDRSTNDYDAIAVSGWFDVDLVDGKEGQLTLEGESNLLEYITTEVKNGKLIIKTEKNVNLKPSNWNSGIRITVPVESVSSISLSGSGDIVGKTTIKVEKLETAMSGSGDITLDIDTNSVGARMSGSGDITFSGNTANFTASISGSGDIKAFELEADNVEATVSGSADIKVT